MPVVVKVDPRSASLYEKGGFRRLKRGRFGAFFDAGGSGIVGTGCGRGRRRRVRRVREKIEAEDKVC